MCLSEEHNDNQEDKNDVSVKSFHREFASLAFCFDGTRAVKKAIASTLYLNIPPRRLIALEGIESCAIPEQRNPRGQDKLCRVNRIESYM